MAIQIKRGQSSNWTSVPGKLEPGQLGIEYRDGKSPRIKVGNFTGTNNFSACSYLSPDTETYGEYGHITQTNHEEPIKITSRVSSFGSVYVDFVFDADAIYDTVSERSLGKMSNPWKEIYTKKLFFLPSALPGYITLENGVDMVFGFASTEFTFKSDSSFVTKTSNTGSIGSSSNYWKSAYITTINATTINLSGKSISKSAISVSGDTLTLSSNILTA